MSSFSALNLAVAVPTARQAHQHQQTIILRVVLTQTTIFPESFSSSPCEYIKTVKRQAAHHFLTYPQ